MKTLFFMSIVGISVLIIWLFLQNYDMRRFEKELSVDLMSQKGLMKSSSQSGNKHELLENVDISSESVESLESVSESITITEDFQNYNNRGFSKCVIMLHLLS